MTDSKNVQVNVSGIVPKQQGQDTQYGNWFLIDENGDFSLDHAVTATVWLVGGGCDGTAGVWNGNTLGDDASPIPDTGTGISYSGSGGDGGYVNTLMNVKIPKGLTLTSVIAQRNDKSGTSLNIDGTLFKCDQTGSKSLVGGAGGSVPLPESGKKYAAQDTVVGAKGGLDGVSTPYGYVGSSGGGGAACNGTSNADNGVEGGTGAGSGTSHRKAGTNAENYGCGGGGGAVCGQAATGQQGGEGKQGCIIIAYSVEQKTLVVERHYTKKCTVKKNCTTNYATSQNSTHCCGNGGCGCSSSGKSFANGVVSANYTDRLEIKNNSESVSDLAAKVQNIETENLVLLKQIHEMENKLGGA